MELLEFFDTIYGEQDGYVTLNTIDQSMPQGSPGAITEKFVKWPGNRNLAERYTRIRQDEDVYCSVAVFTAKERTGRDTAATAQVVWADADTCPIDAFDVPPSIVVKTSEGRHHAWWVLDKPEAASDCSAVARAISKRHEDQGCDHGFQVSKILRVPTTTNNKGEPFLVAAQDTGARYSLAQLQEAYPPAEAVSVGSEDEPDECSQQELFELQSHIPPDLIDLYTTQPLPGQSWSQRAYRLEVDLLRFGFSPEDVLNLMMDAACNKYRPEAAGHTTQEGDVIPLRQNPRDVTWGEIQKAVAALEAERLVDELKVVSSGDRKNVERPVFVTDAERTAVENDPNDVINLYVDLAKRAAPDSSETFHRTLAYQLLACVFGDLVKIDLPYMARAFGNQWSIILGASSLSRKTTATSFFDATLASVDKARWGEENRTYIGSDATAEGLIKRLAERPEMSSLIEIDEVQGFFEAASSKKYLTGTKDAYTKLFDGTVPGVVRSRKEDSTPSVAAAFNLVGLGVDKRVIEAISKSDFESGFLLRAVWAKDEEREYKKGDLGVYFAQNHPERANLEAIKRDREDLALFLAQCYIAAAGRLSVCHMDRQTEDRFNEWVDRLFYWLKSFDLDFIVPAASRLSMTVLRSSAARAVMEGTGGLIGMTQLLPVLVQAELWARDLIRVAVDLTTSAWESELDDMYAFMSEYALKEPNVPDPVISRRFAQFRPKDLEDRLVALRMQGRIRIAAGLDGNVGRGIRRWEVLPNA